MLEGRNKKSLIDIKDKSDGFNLIKRIFTPSSPNLVWAGEAPYCRSSRQLRHRSARPRGHSPGNRSSTHPDGTLPLLAPAIYPLHPRFASEDREASRAGGSHSFQKTRLTWLPEVSVLSRGLSTEGVVHPRLSPAELGRAARVRSASNAFGSQTASCNREVHGFFIALAARRFCECQN